MDLLSRIKELSSAYHQDIIDIRRHLHAHPELSNQEYKTAGFIAQQLAATGIAFQEGVGGTGLVGIIEGGSGPGRVLALRADMDALPITEENEVLYKSLNTGVMHACGHDVHMACLLGAARILHALRDHWGGTVKLIFQPAEETAPGGAKRMIEEGVLEHPSPEVVFGQHVFVPLPVGKVGVRSGKYMASADEIYLTVKGKGGHAATPHLNTDPIVIASHIVVALQTIVSRSAQASMPSVLSFGKFAGMGRTNIIPSEVSIEGTFRTFDEKWRAEALHRITAMAKGIAQGMGGDCQVYIEKGYPFLVNDDKLADAFRRHASDYLGGENLVELDLAMTAEDFAFFSQKLPSCFYRLGISNAEKGITSNLHTPTFNIDERALEIGMGLMAYLTVSEIQAG
jgi:amidohydrolase